MKKDSIYFKTIAEDLCKTLKIDKSNIILIWNILMGTYLDGRNDEKELMINANNNNKMSNM